MICYITKALQQHNGLKISVLSNGGMVYYDILCVDYWCNDPLITKNICFAKIPLFHPSDKTKRKIFVHRLTLGWSILSHSCYQMIDKENHHL